MLKFAPLFLGCPKCFSNQAKQHPAFKNLTFNDVHERSLRNIERTRAAGYNVVLVYEHEIMQMLKMDVEMRDFFNDVTLWQNYTEPIGVRDALFGKKFSCSVFLVSKLCIYFCSRGSNGNRRIAL